MTVIALVCQSQFFGIEDLEHAMKDPESAIFDSTASRDPAKLGFRGDFLMCG